MDKETQIRLSLINLGIDPDKDFFEQINPSDENLIEKIKAYVASREYETYNKGYDEGAKESPHMTPRESDKVLDMELVDIVQDVVAEDYRAEAMYILSNTSSFRRNEIIKYYKDDKHNIVCMHLDLLKAELVELGLMDNRVTDAFGGIFLENDEE